MDFESFKEQLIERLTFYKTQIEDSEIYIRLKERYDTLQPRVQNLIKYGSLLFLAYFFYSIPASFVNSANEKMQFFEENRLLTRDLIRAGRIDKNVKPPPIPPSDSSLTSEVDSILNAESVLPEQKMAAAPKENIASKSLVPKDIKQGGIKTSMKQLNLRQVIRVGEALNEVRGSQLFNLVIQADNKDPHYFSADYEVATFDVPRDPVESPQIDNKKKNRFSKKNKKKSSK